MSCKRHVRPAVRCQPARQLQDAETSAMLFHLPQVDFATGRGLQECMDKLGPLAR